MPTDEQLRERFEKWAETESFDLTANIHTGKYIYSDTLTAWLTWQARDAEVQALRERNNQLMEALKDYVDADEMAVGEGYGTYPKSEHRRIRALVAGEEGTNDE